MTWQSTGLLLGHELLHATQILVASHLHSFMTVVLWVDGGIGATHWQILRHWIKKKTGVMLKGGVTKWDKKRQPTSTNNSYNGIYTIYTIRVD